MAKIFRREPVGGNQPTGTERSGLLDERHRPVTLSLLSSISLVAYNNLSVTAALPDIGNDLGSVGLLPWVVTVELLASAIAVLAIGPVVDGFGVRSVYRVSMVAFVASSVACALSAGMAVLIVARVGQGLAAGGVIGTSLTSIGLSFDGAARPKMYAALSAVWGVMGIAGPAIAALLISLLGWRWVFLVIVPIGLGAMLVGWSKLPGRRDTAAARSPERAGFDRWGLALVTVITVCLLVGASTASWWAAVYLAVGAVLVAVYVTHAGRIAEPVVRLEHLTGRRWRNIHLTSSLAVAGGTGAGAYLPVYLKGARGLSSGQAAFSVLFMVFGWSAAAWLASKLLERMEPPPVIVRGSLTITVGCGAAAVAAGFELPVAILLPCFLLVGGGIGMMTTSGLALLQSRAADDEMGRASSAHQFVRSLGFAYGAALAGLVLFFVIDRRIDDVEAIRRLLGDGDTSDLSRQAVAALQAGYTSSLVLMGLLASGTVLSARRLSRET